MGGSDEPMNRAEQLSELRRKFGYRCAYCGIPESLSPRSNFAIDHFVPKSIAPEVADDFDNLVFACATCNARKGSWFRSSEDHLTLVHRGRADYARHLALAPDGTYSARTKDGEFTIHHLRLNEDSAVQFRALELRVTAHRDEMLGRLARVLSKDQLPERERQEIEHEFELLRLSLDRFPDALDLDGSQPLFTIDTLEAERELSSSLMLHLKRNPSDVDRLNPYVVEDLVAEYYAAKGFEVVSLGRDPRSGADLVALRIDGFGDEVRYLVEVKRLGERVGVQEVHRVLGAMNVEKHRLGWDLAVLWSTSSFTDFRAFSNQDLRMLGLVLKDREEMMHLLRDYKPTTAGGLWLPSDWRIRRAFEDPEREDE